jgi:hypothetical protein
MSGSCVQYATISKMNVDRIGPATISILTSSPASYGPTRQNTLVFSRVYFSPITLHTRVTPSFQVSGDVKSFD